MNNVTSKGTKENYRERVKQIIHKNPVEDCITPNANVLSLKIKQEFALGFKMHFLAKLQRNEQHV